MRIKLSRFDVYTKIAEDDRIRTRYGAFVSIACGLVMLWLFLSEFSYYLSPDLKPELEVDTVRGEKFKIYFDITFHNMPCSYISLDIMDHSEEHAQDYKDIFKSRLTLDGENIKSDAPMDEEEFNFANEEEVDENYCGSCYGAEEKNGQCCNTCEAVRKAYLAKGWSIRSIDSFEQCQKEGYSGKILQKKNEGCRIYGQMKVNKISGNFHVAPGQSYKSNNQHVHDLDIFKFASTFNMSHTIHYLGFGSKFPGVVNPLDETTKIWTHEGAPMYQYFIKIVPTVYQYSSGKILDTNQYSATDYERHLHAGANHAIPGVFFNFDFSPIRVTYREGSHTFAHFLTNVCAIVGGVFTIASMIDSIIFYWFKIK